MKTLSSLVETALEDLLIEYAVKRDLDCERVFPCLVEAILNRKGLVEVASEFQLHGVESLYDLIPEAIEDGERLLDSADFPLLSHTLEKLWVVFFTSSLECLGEIKIHEKLRLRE